jgi:uncharacterized RDD family membrane protein YckC
MDTDVSVRAAGSGRRLANYLLDLFILLVILYFIDPVIAKILGDRLRELICLPFIINLLVQFFYYFLFEGFTSKTPAKIITRTHVTNREKTKSDWRAIALRTLIRFIPFEPISLYTGKEDAKKGTWWHDRWSKTRVIMD